MPVCLILAFPIATSAAPLASAASSSQEATHELTFGLDARYYDYKEYVDLPKASTESGILPGFTAAYKYNASFFDATTQLYFSPGTTNYNGTTQQAVPITGSTKNIFLYLEEDFGLKLPFGFTTYTGIAYNLWMRDLDPLGHATYTGLQENYTWWYIPVGLSWKIDLSDSIYLLFGAEANFMISARINAIWSGAIQNAADNSVPLGTTLGGKVYAKVGYKLSPTLGITVMPFFQYSGFTLSPTFELTDTSGNPILDSKTQQAQFFDEPSSSHRSYGATVALTAWFY